MEIRLLDYKLVYRIQKFIFSLRTFNRFLQSKKKKKFIKY